MTNGKRISRLPKLAKTMGEGTRHRSGAGHRQTPRASHLRRHFGITEEQYDALLQRQSGCCAVCQRPATTFSKRLAVDHNHQTLEIRGLLCVNCNRYVIGRHTDANLLDSAARYLRQGTGLYVPANRKRRRSRRKKRAR